MIDLQKTIFIMDGPSDIRAFTGKFQKEFGTSPQFRKAPCNGHTVSAEGYANGVRGIIDLALTSSFLHIFCVLDREKRNTTAEKLSTDIHKILIEKLSSKKISKEELNEKIRIVVADRMMENWIIADIEGIKSKKDLVKESATQDNFDGEIGVKILKRIMKTNYNKIQHAPVLLKAISLDRATSNSPSFKNLMCALEAQP